MFKKIEIWILYLFILLSLPFAGMFGFLVRQELAGKYTFGKLSEGALFIAEIPSKLKKIHLGEHKVELNVIDRFSDFEGFNGIPNNEESYLLLSKYDGDLEEQVIELVDLRNFEVLHTWNPDIDKFNELIESEGEFKYLKRDNKNSRARLSHPKLLKDGGLVFHHSPLIKIDSCSDLLFIKNNDVYHHSIETDIDGNIWAPSHIYPQTLNSKIIGTKLALEGGYYEDGLVKLSPEGEILYQKSLSQIFIDNGLFYLLFGQGNDFERDPMHLNDIQPVDFDSEYWKKGDVFLSLKSLSMVILYRPSTNKIIWRGTGPFVRQHDIDILDDHKISIFDNNYVRTIDKISVFDKNSIRLFDNDHIVDGNNEVIIYDFKTNKYSSYLDTSLEKHDVRTITEGRSQILPNGDLYVEETNYGRTLYFNSDGSIRWTHVNRAKNGKVYMVSWSRILYEQDDIFNVNKFLRSKNNCND